MNVYGYVRVSRDEDKENYGTIETQKKMIELYVKEIGFEVKNTIEDDNVSGYTFDREGLDKLKTLIEDGQVNILISKDLSRIGRHNAKTLLFLDYLEEYNVRLILINDNYDSSKDDDDIIGIMTWYNEKYIKDLSKKNKTSLRIRQEGPGGLLTKVSFGYMRDEKNKNGLILDDEAAEIVRRIFKLYIDGHGGRVIANILQNEGVPTPSKYQFMKTGKRITSNIADNWNSTHVIRIIKNDVYIGILRCGKTERKKINGKTYRLEEDKHIVHENHHEPIISMEDFQLAQKIVQSRIENNVRGTSNGINLFTGFLACRDCGGGFMKVNKKRSAPSYICTNNFRYGASCCSSHKISEEQLKAIILDKLAFMKKYIEKNIGKIDIELNRLSNFNANHEKSVSRHNKKIREKKEEIKNYSRQLAKGLIDEEIAIEMINESNAELSTLNKQSEELLKLQESNANAKEKAISSLEIINGIINNGDLTRRDIETLIKRIYIKQISKPKHGVKPELNIEIEWDVFISSVYNIIDLYSNEYALPWGCDNTLEQIESIVNNDTITTSHDISQLTPTSS